EDILDEVSGLTVNSPDESLEEGPRLILQSPRGHQEDKTCTGTGQKSTEQVTAFCRSLHDMNPLECPMSSSSSSSSSSLSPSPVSALPPTAGAATQRQLSHADKLRKVINELVETEKTYVNLDVLFGNLGEMVEFQVEFLRTLEDGIRLVPDLDRLERVEQFKKVLFSLGGSFLYYADRFKIYSAFCASHTKVPKVLAKAKTEPDFKAFLAERNPRQQHSSTLESYLIKPIQRVLKYPLLLKELYSLTDPDSEEHYHLDVAMKAMNKVASHINEMQKLHEEYGAVFDQLINEQTADRKEVADLSMGDLLLHSSVVWINPPASLVKSKKDPDLAAFAALQPVSLFQGASHRASVSDDRDPFRFRHMISTDCLQVRALPNSEGTAGCEIVHTRSESEGRPERTFQLCCRYDINMYNWRYSNKRAFFSNLNSGVFYPNCSSPDSKKDFLKAVHSILREKQRRQLLKTDSLPSNQQYVPFGGKRLCALKGARPIMNRAASAPSRTLARRKLVRNRFTIDTDLVFHGNNNNSNDPEPSQHSSCPPLSQHALLQSHKPQGEDTDRWVEEQFDLACYEDQGGGIDVGQVKETDILSDDDEYCKSVRAASAEPADLDGKMEGLGLEGGQMRSHNPNGPVATQITSSVTQDEEVNRIKHGDDSRSVDSFTSCGASLSRCANPAIKLAPLKQCAVEGATNNDHDVIWVRRDDFANGCNSNVF
ncbi:T-lymphoma invasion and metastasis-inducing protein 1, partial [Nibea albiflora]